MPVYFDKRSKRWRWRFFRAGRRYSGSAPAAHNTARAAAQLERAAVEKLIGGQPLGNVPTVRAFAPRFLEHQAARTKPLTRVQQKATVENHIVPHLGHLLLDQVDKAAIDQVVTEWRGTLAPKTINARLGTLRRFLSVAFDWRLIPRMPKFQFLRLPKEHPRFLTEGEAKLVVDATDPLWRAMVFVGLRTGLRVGELRGLQWGDIDFARRVVHVRRTDPGRRLLDATSPKGNSARTVPLTPDTIAELEHWLASVADRSPGAWVWPALLRRRGESRSRPRSEKGCYHALWRAVDAVKLADVGWHTLRHSFASWLVMRGVPLRVVQQYLGHASIVQTEKYAHLTPDFGHAAVALLDTPIAGPEWQPVANSLPATPAKSSSTRSLPAGRRAGSRSQPPGRGRGSNRSRSRPNRRRRPRRGRTR